MGRRANWIGSCGERELQKTQGSQKQADAFYNNQMLDRLNDPMQSFIAEQEMVFISTADARGECDCSIRAGLAGFVRILDEQTLLYPEYRGNGVFASLGNLSENPQIGLLFVDFLRDTIGLHVNGRAEIVENDQLLLRTGLPDNVRTDIEIRGGRKPEQWVCVTIREAYIHCSKHIPLLAKREKEIDWGTDDVRKKGGDYFAAKKSNRATRDRS